LSVDPSFDVGRSVVKVFLVRHAKAEKRSEWDGPDPLRPLTSRGLRQAREVSRRLAAEPIERILTSPYLRCRQTVEPLGAALGLPVEVHERLAEGESPAKALDLLRGLKARAVVCCTHTDLIRELSAELEENGVEIGRPTVDPDARAFPDSERLGVLDLGSTSFHLLVADVTRAGRLTEVASQSEMLRLGAVIASSAHIPDDVSRRAVEAARALRRFATRSGAERLLPVATAALRDADNGAELAGRIADACGAKVRLLSGEEEARLMFAAFRRRVPMPSGWTLGADLGGGSLELAIGDPHEIAWEATLRLGVARLHGELVATDPMRTREARAVYERVRDEIAPHLPGVRSRRPRLFVVAGGSARALGHLVVALRGLRPARSVNQLAIPLDELRQTTDLLVRSSHDERLRLPGIRKRRADLLPTAALVLTALAEALGVDPWTVSDWGLREGVLLDAAGPRSAHGRSAGRS
jgi:phosphohistidine phosphatase SixA